MAVSSGSLCNFCIETGIKPRRTESSQRLSHFQRNRNIFSRGKKGLFFTTVKYSLEAVRQRHSGASAEESQNPSSRPGWTQDDNSTLPGACPELVEGLRIITAALRRVVREPFCALCDLRGNNDSGVFWTGTKSSL